MKVPDEAVMAAATAIERELLSGRDYSMAQDSDEALARVALEAAAPILADQIATAILRYADQHEPLTGSGAYVAWHRHFDAASAVAAKAFGRDNLEAVNDSAPAGAVKEDGGP